MKKRTRFAMGYVLSFDGVHCMKQTFLNKENRKAGPFFGVVEQEAHGFVYTYGVCRGISLFSFLNVVFNFG